MLLFGFPLAASIFTYLTLVLCFLLSVGWIASTSHLGSVSLDITVPSLLLIKFHFMALTISCSPCFCGDYYSERWGRGTKLPEPSPVVLSTCERWLSTSAAEIVKRLYYMITHNPIFQGLQKQRYKYIYLEKETNVEVVKVEVNSY